MKVLHVIPSLSEAHGGPTQALVLMERALAQQGIEAHTATTDDDGRGRFVERPLGVPFAENGATRFYFRKQAEFYKPSLPLARWLAVHARDYDVLHLHALFSFSTAAAARAARKAGVPYVVRPLGTLDEWGLQQRRPWLKRLSLRLIEAPLLRGAAAVHFTSEDEARQARQLGIPWREAIVPLAVEPYRPPDAAAQDRFRILYLSRLTPKKNVEALLDAMPALAASFAQVELRIAGDGDPAYVAQLKMRANALGPQVRVSWAGHVEGEDKAREWSRAGVFVLPSHSENFGVAAAEALAAGLPCVLGQGVAIARDVAGAAAGVAVAPQAEAIADGLRRIIGDAARRDVMAANARALAERQFSVAAMGARLKQLYSDILQQR